MDDFKVQRIRLEDGRNAELRVRETGDERIEELHCEPERELVMTQRLVEKKKPMVVERTVEKINKSGEVVERKTETLDPENRLEVRSHIVLAKTQTEADADAADMNAPITRAELKDVIVAAVRATQTAVKTTRITPAAEQAVQSRVEAEEKFSWTNLVLFAAIAVLGGGLAYVTFWM